MNRCLLIDLDGTLADSVGVMRDVYCDFLRERGSEGSEEEFARLNGPPLSEVIEHLQVNHSLVGGASELTRAYLDSVRAAYPTVQVHVGGHEIVAAARRAGWSVGIVTSNQEPLARAWVVERGLAVDVIVTEEMVDRGKPAPEPYHLALSLLEADVDGSVAIEDSPAGAQAALAAGLRTFVVGPRRKDAPSKAARRPDLWAVSRELFGD